MKFGLGASTERNGIPHIETVLPAAAPAQRPLVALHFEDGILRALDQPVHVVGVLLRKLSAATGEEANRGLGYGLSQRSQSRGIENGPVLELPSGDFFKET